MQHVSHFTRLGAHKRASPPSHSRQCTMQVFCQHEWDHLLALLPYVPWDRPVHVLDAGANIGLASLVLTAFIRHHGTITAVEASPPTFQQLQRNMQNSTAVVLVNAAVVPEWQAGTSVSFGNVKQSAFLGARIQTVGAPLYRSTSSKRVAAAQRAVAAGEPLLRAADKFLDDGDAASDSSFKVQTMSLRQLAVRDGNDICMHFSMPPPGAQAGCMVL